MSATVTLHESWDSVDPAEWDALVGDGSPFLEHAWLTALHDSGSACEATGWRPRPITVHLEGRLRAGLPAWLVDHDRGQFVYQGHWSRAAEEAGLSLYPKVVVGVPFTPVTGQRMLVSAGPDLDGLIQALMAGLEQASQDAKGVHVLFPGQAELPLWTAVNFFERSQFQYHWLNHGYSNYGDFLARFRSRRRKDLKRERRVVAHLDIQTVESPTVEVLREVWRAYENTVERYGASDRFLTPEFFELLAARFAHRLVAIVARRDGHFVGGALNVRKGERLYGRYWGQVEDVRFLHFELCYHQGIDYCIRHGLQAFEPGHGGDHKYNRGFEPVRTWSTHSLAHRGAHRSFAKAAERESEWVTEKIAQLDEDSPLKD